MSSGPASLRGFWSIDIALVAFVRLQLFYVPRSIFLGTSPADLDYLMQSFIDIFSHAACIAANIEMSSLFEPIPDLLGILDHAMLYVDLEILIPRKCGIEPSQHTFALVRYQFFLVEEVAA